MLISNQADDAWWAELGFWLFLFVCIPLGITVTYIFGEPKIDYPE